MEVSTLRKASDEKGNRKFMRYAFFKTSTEWRSLDEDTKRKRAGEFLLVFRKYSRPLSLRLYSLLATRADVDLMIWATADNLDHIQEFTSELMASGLGRQLTLVYSFLAMTRKSKYTGTHRHPEQEGDGSEAPPRMAKYAFVYPLVKKREWYKVPFVERQRIMAEHFKIGHRYPSIKINTGYSFGLDDQEFVLAFEGDSPAEFLDLVEELRSSEASTYTERETPIFTCAAIDPPTMVKLLG